MWTVRITLNMTFPPTRPLPCFAAQIGVCLARASHSFFEFVSMFKSVLARRHSFKVVIFIIRLNPVVVVDKLIRRQQSTVVLFPNKAMLKNVASAVSVRMVGFMNSDIPAANASTSLPMRAVPGRLLGSVVARNIGQRVAAKVSQPSRGLSRGRSRFAASAFTDTGRDLIRGWSVTIRRVIGYDWVSHAVDSLSVNGLVRLA